MVYSRFRIQCLLRVGFLMSLIFVLLYLLSVKNYYLTAMFVTVLILYNIYSLIHYVEATNRHLTSFLESIRYADFSRSFQFKGLGSSFDELRNAFNDVIKDFQKIRSEKEEQYHYLQNVIQHIGIGLIAFRKDGQVELVNSSAKKIFQVNQLTRIQSLETISQEVVDTLLGLTSGDKILMKVTVLGDDLQLAVYATEFKLRNHEIILASIQNIHTELEAQEMESWQNLIQVQTHEIMNSITPIASLAETLDTRLKETGNSIRDQLSQDTDKEIIGDIQDALDTILRRSKGLIHYVESYRDLTRIPKPSYKIMAIENLFTNVKRLMENEVNQKGIELRYSVHPRSLELTADEELMEQVLINLIKNSLFSLTDVENGFIEMKALLNNQNRIVIQIIDNGSGIVADEIDKIFIPFFSTHPGGSGIGLSLSRQIMRLHGGTITASSIPEKETVFTLKF